MNNSYMGKETQTTEPIASQVLNELMDSQPISEYALSKATGVPQSTIHRIKTGQSKDPRMSNLRKIADYFNVGVMRFRGVVDPGDRDEQIINDNYMLPADIRRFIWVLFVVPYIDIQRMYDLYAGRQPTEDDLAEVGKDFNINMQEGYARFAADLNQLIDEPESYKEVLDAWERRIKDLIETKNRANT